MADVNLYHVGETGLVEGTALGRLTVVLAVDFDRVTAERDQLQVDLNARDQHIDELEQRLPKMCDCNQGRLPCTCKPATQHQSEPSAPKCKACGDTGVIDDKEKDELSSGHFVERGLVACKQCEDSSAPVERDELKLPMRCDEQTRTRRAFDYAQGWNQALDAVEKMNARAALERKP